MYTTLKRQCAHLSPIISGDGASTGFSTSSSSSDSTTYAPPPPSAVVSSSNSTNDFDTEEPNWRVPSTINRMNSARKVEHDSLQSKPKQDLPPSKLRKITSQIDNRYACIEKKSSRIVRFRDENRHGSTTTLDSTGTTATGNETASSFWSDGAASYGFSKYVQPQFRQPNPPPPSPNSKSIQQKSTNFPRTNPYATLPRNFSAHYPTGVNGLMWPLSESSNSTTTSSGESNTGDNVWTKYDRRFQQGETKSIFSSTIANAQRRRILAGLKSFGIKGELLISILLNRGLVTVQIDEARNLTSPCVSGCCSTYVRLSLMPDEEKRTQCKTELIPYSNRPVFHQTFTVELLPEDYEKRLVISMWHRESAKEKSVLMGCMAFTIKHMVESNKVIDGWYFLLAPEYGRKKHLAVHKVNMLTYYGDIDSNSEIRNNVNRNDLHHILL